MNSEREILIRLLENQKLNTNEPLDEKTYTVGDTQYWRRSGKCYKWTASGGRVECSEEEYYKALSGGTSGNDKVKNTDPANDKAKDTNSTKKLSNPKIVDDISKRYGIDPSDVEEVFVGDHGYEYFYKGDETKSLGFYNDKNGTLSSGIDKSELYPDNDKVKNTEPSKDMSKSESDPKDVIKNNLTKKYGSKVTLGSLEKMPNRNKPGHDAYFVKGYYKDNKGHVNRISDLMYVKSETNQDNNKSNNNKTTTAKINGIDADVTIPDLSRIDVNSGKVEVYINSGKYKDQYAWVDIKDVDDKSGKLQKAIDKQNDSLYKKSTPKTRDEYPGQYMSRGSERNDT